MMPEKYRKTALAADTMKDRPGRVRSGLKNELAKGLVDIRKAGRSAAQIKHPMGRVRRKEEPRVEKKMKPPTAITRPAYNYHKKPDGGRSFK